MTAFHHRIPAILRRALVPALVVGLWAAPAEAGPYLVYDAASGEVLAENDAFVPWYPASLTKLMTAYVTFGAIRNGRIRPDTPVVMSEFARREPPSKMGFKAGTAVTVDTALKILIVKSANDVAVALAETVGGSEQEFVALMNAEARRLGMSGTRFANANGLPDNGQWTTARDFGLLSRAIIREYPEWKRLFGITGLALGGKVIKSHNHMLDRFPGSDGMKTGFICASGFNIVASATRGGRQLVAVVLGERNAKVRAEKTAELLQTAFDTGSGLFSRRTKLEALRPSSPVPAEPTDMRPYVCGKNRNAGEDADGEVVAKAGSGGLAPASYLVPKFHVMDPVPIAILGTVAPPPSAAVDDAAPRDPNLPPLPRPKPIEIGGVVPAAVDAVAGYAPAEGLPVPPLPPDAPPIRILGLKGSDG